MLKLVCSDLPFLKSHYYANQKCTKQRISKNSQEIERFLTKFQLEIDPEQGTVIPIDDYQHLGHTVKAILKVLQTAMLTESEYPELTEHNKYDVYNLLNLAQSLIPESEMELLDLLNSK